MIFTNPQTWIQLLTLIFLEMVLGIDNLVFIAITTDRLADGQKILGRRFGLIAALCMRVMLLFSLTWIISLKLSLFTLPFTIPGTDPGISGKDLILLVGGLYLIYKGIVELKEKVSADEQAASDASGAKKSRQIGLFQAIGTIALMDIIFSLDSVITAVGMADQILVMVFAVMIAVFVMIIFANPISEFINRNHEVKILALGFIVAVGVKLVTESLGIELVIEHTEVDVFDVVLYFAMLFSLVLTSLQMLHNRNRAKALAAAALEDADVAEKAPAPAREDAADAATATPEPQPDADIPPQ